MQGNRIIEASLICLMLTVSATDAGHAQERLRVQGLNRPVEIIKDRWGISHIYAQTEADLFFAQGFSAERDRLFQF